MFAIQNVMKNPHVLFETASGLMIQQQGKSGLIVNTAMFGCTTNVPASIESQESTFALNAKHNNYHSLN